MYVSMKSMLNHANINKYAIMAVNCCNMEVVKAAIHAAEEEKAPIIINISPRQFKAHASLDSIVPMIQTMAKLAMVPIALNLDHGQEYEDIFLALRHGFTSIMFDGSALPYNENRDRTYLVATLAHSMNASVEAELGHVGQATEGDGEKLDFYTNVEQAKLFIEETGIDALAVAIGTAHGKYPKNFIPALDFERLRDLKEKLGIPLVLHGGSGAGEENIKRAVELGINKINVCTDVFEIGKEAIIKAVLNQPKIDYLDLMHIAELEMKAYIKNYLRLIGSNERYDYSMSIKKEMD